MFAQTNAYLEELLMFTFRRDCNASWKVFLVANADDEEEELVWARARGAVRKCLVASAEGAAAADGCNDCPTSRMATAITVAEHARLQQYLDFYDDYDEVLDLGQNPQHRPLHSQKGILHTLINGARPHVLLQPRQVVVFGGLVHGDGIPDHGGVPSCVWAHTMPILSRAVRNKTKLRSHAS